MIRFSSVFSRCGFHEEAISSLLHTDNWNMALMESKLNGHSQEQFTSLCRKFSGMRSYYDYTSNNLIVLHCYVKLLHYYVIVLHYCVILFTPLIRITPVMV